MTSKDRRTYPYRVIRRISSRCKFTVFETLDHKEAVSYVKRAQALDGDNAHYSIDYKCGARSLRRMAMPMPELH